MRLDTICAGQLLHSRKPQINTFSNFYQLIILVSDPRKLTDSFLRK